MSAKNRWQETGGRATAAAKTINNLQPLHVGPPNFSATDTEEQFRRARSTYIGLFLLMVTVWSTFLISAICALRVNLDDCEYCPDDCQCRSQAPAWG
jgi:hypothetical protein